MRRYKLELLAREFNFLEQIARELNLNLMSLDDIKIARGDKALLDRKGNEDYYQERHGNGHDDYTHFFAIRDGIVAKLESAGKTNTPRENKEWDCDTIGEQLFSRDINPDFIVECSKVDPDDFGTRPPRLVWKIYKMSKLNMVAYYKRQIDSAACQIKREISAIWRMKK